VRAWHGLGTGGTHLHSRHTGNEVPGNGGEEQEEDANSAGGDAGETAVVEPAHFRKVRRQSPSTGAAHRGTRARQNLIRRENAKRLRRTVFPEQNHLLPTVKHSLAHARAMFFTNTARGAENNPLNEDAKGGHRCSQRLFRRQAHRSHARYHRPRSGPACGEPSAPRVGLQGSCSRGRPPSPPSPQGFCIATEVPAGQASPRSPRHPPSPPAATGRVCSALTWRGITHKGM